MSKLKEIINFLKKRNSKIFQLKKNIELTISEIKKKDFSFSESKKFTLIYVGAVFLVLSLFSGGSAKNYIEVEALVCKNDTGKTVYKVERDKITAIGVYSKFTGMNKNLAKGNKELIYQLTSNDNTGFSYTSYNSIYKKNNQMKYDYKKNLMFMDEKKLYDCDRQSSFVEAPKKIKTNAKMSNIKDAFKHAAKYRWASGGMACDLNGGVYNEYSRKYGELFTSNGKPNAGTARRVVNIDKISDHKFKVKIEFYNNAAMFRAYGDMYPVTITEKTFTLVEPDKMTWRSNIKMADYKNLNVVSYTNKSENGTTEICE
mgnify:FL=1